MRWLARKFMDVLWWDWTHVGIFKTTGNYSGDEVLIHCFESRWGSRRAKMVALDKTPGSKWRETVKRKKIWQTRIYPWLVGARDPDIPSYKAMKDPKEEFLDKLKGVKFPRIINDT